MMVDEADIDLVGNAASTHGNSASHRGAVKRSASHSGLDPGSPRPPNKRKPGPIPKDIVVRRPNSPFSFSPPPSPSASPTHTWSAPNFSSDPPPPVLVPAVPIVNQSCPLVSGNENKDDTLSPVKDIGLLEPPKLLVNGDIGKFSILEIGILLKFYLFVCYVLKLWTIRSYQHFNSDFLSSSWLLYIK